MKSRNNCTNFQILINNSAVKHKKTSKHRKDTIALLRSDALLVFVARSVYFNSASM